MIDFIPNGDGTFSVPNLLDPNGRLVRLPANRRWRSGLFYDSVILPATILSTTDQNEAQVTFFNNDAASGTKWATNRTGNESIPKDSVIIADSFFVHIDTNYGNQRASGDDIAAVLSAMHVSVKLGSQGDVLVDEPAVTLGNGGIGLFGSDFSGAGAAVLTNGTPNQAARRTFDIPILISGDCDSLFGRLSFKTPQANTRYQPVGTTFTAYTPSVPLRILVGFRGVVSP